MSEVLRLGVKLPPAFDDRDEYFDDARALEAIGIDSIWLAESTMRPAVSEGGRDPAGFTFPPALEPWSLLCGLATVTQRVRVGLSIGVVAMWPPVLFALLVNSLEHLGGGRTIVGVGAGWEPLQFEATGVPYSHRGRRLSEFIDVVRHLWAGSHEPYAGEFYQVPGLRLAPSLRGSPPIFFGGSSERAYLTLAHLCDGYIYPPGSDPEQVGLAFKRVQELRAVAGAEGPFEFWVEVMPPATRKEWLVMRDRWAEAGASGVIVQGLGRRDWREMLSAAARAGQDKIPGIRLDRGLLEILAP